VKCCNASSTTRAAASDQLAHSINGAHEIPLDGSIVTTLITYSEMSLFQHKAGGRQSTRF